MKYANIQNETLDTLYNDVSIKRSAWNKADAKDREQAEKAAKTAKKAFDDAVFEAVIKKCFEQENPVIAFMSDTEIPVMRMSETKLDRDIKTDDKFVWKFFKEFESLKDVDHEKKNKYCPAHNWTDTIEAARKACVGYVSMQEISEELQADHCNTFETTWQSKKTVAPLEKDKAGKFSKSACKRALNDMVKALFVTPEGEKDFRCLKDNQVSSVLAKISKSKNGESTYCKSPKEFFFACIPMLTAYVTGTEIKQRFNGMTDKEKEDAKWDAPVATTK